MTTATTTDTNTNANKDGAEKPPEVKKTSAGNIIHADIDIPRIMKGKVTSGYVVKGAKVSDWLTANAETDPTGSYWLVDPDKIVWCDDLQVPGRIVNAEDVADMVPSIAADQIQPIVCAMPKTKAGKPVVVVGHRRHLSCALLGKKVKVVPFTTEAKDWFGHALDTVAAENVQQKSLNVPQMAGLAARRIPKGRNKGEATAEAFARSLGKSEVYARGLASIGHNLDRDVMAAWLKNPRKLTYDNAKVIGQLAPSVQKDVFEGKKSIAEAKAEAKGETPPPAGDTSAKRPSKKALEAAEAAVISAMENCAPEAKERVAAFQAGLRAALGYSYQAPLADLSSDKLFPST